MKPLYTQEEYMLSKSIDELPLECYYCSNIFLKKKKYITSELNLNKGEVKFCSQKCSKSFNITKETINCTNCNTEFTKTQGQIKKSKSGNHFCSKSCAATFNNKNKKTGTRRSKLEAWLEEQLINLYSDLDIHFNRKDTIGSELDIYIPSLNIAFELNGIFHYEPIYGNDKLQKIQENDISKSKACHEHKIDLCVIDTSGQKYFKPATSQKYLDIINTIINERLY